MVSRCWYGLPLFASVLCTCTVMCLIGVYTTVDFSAEFHPVFELVDSVTGDRSEYTGPYTLRVLAGGTGLSDMNTFKHWQNVYVYTFTCVVYVCSYVFVCAGSSVLDIIFPPYNYVVCAERLKYGQLQPKMSSVIPITKSSEPHY